VPSLIIDSSGDLYGTTDTGGASDDGTIFELTKGSSTITTLATFNSSNGSVSPYVSESPTTLMMDSSGNLYGTTFSGGASGEGSIFELAKGSSTITTLASFNGTNGANPHGGLIMDGSGNLYGTTGSGGATNGGTVFELTKGSSTITTLASFIVPPSGAFLSTPNGVVMDGNGDLFGTTEFAYDPNKELTGGVFELAKGSSTITWLTSFNGFNGGTPETRLIIDGSGNLYGTTSGSFVSTGGTVFELAKGSTTITTLASVNSTVGPLFPSSLIMDGSGNLYGTTLGGAGSVDGTVFELAKGSGTINTLASFNATKGSGPDAGLIMDDSGNLYGTASGGGVSDVGTVFELAKGSGAITTLAYFNQTNAVQLSGLIMDDSGNLYGTAMFGGASNDGTVFELAKGSSTLTILASFNGTNGSNPSGLIMDGNGNLYGTTANAGRGGTIFELAKGSSTLTTLASFNGTNGSEPSSLIMDGSGNLYGTTSAGGASEGGTIFELAKGSSTITTLASFNSTNGSVSSLIMDGSGNLYGTTGGGGASNEGTIFELAKGSTTITILASFNGTNGLYPHAGLVMDGNGNLYGTTSGGLNGASGVGTVFELAKGSSTITTLASFNGANGLDPEAGLILDGSGNLYGTTIGGGPADWGTIFEVQKSTSGTTSPPPSPPTSPVPSPPPSPPAPSPPALNVPPLLAFFDSFLGGTETVNANGTERITDSIFGIPLLVSTFDSSGNLESVTLFGINVTALFEML
jgi:uncharacterized repeat protein (TIGR03803 family)